jgi:hypothetical protein
MLTPTLRITAPFRHRDHVRFAWAAVRDHGLAGALTAVPAAIRVFAAEQGAAQKYHETLTRCWIRLIAAAQRETGAASFEALIAARPELLDAALPRRYYSESLLQSAAARAGDVEPDRAPLPPMPEAAGGSAPAVELHLDCRHLTSRC